jgi:hypothetical protein
MSLGRRMVTWAALLALGVAALAGCSGGTKTTATSTATAAGSSAAATGGTSGTAVESNPGGDIPDSQAFVPYRDAGGLFTVTVPEGWAQTPAAGATVFTDKYNSIRVESRALSSAPTVDSVRTIDLPAVQASAEGFTPGTVTSVNRKSGPAILLTYRANSIQNPVTGKVAADAVERYAFWRNGREVILTLSAPVGSDNVDPWRKVTDTFTWGN